MAIKPLTGVKRCLAARLRDSLPLIVVSLLCCRHKRFLLLCLYTNAYLVIHRIHRVIHSLKA